MTRTTYFWIMAVVLIVLVLGIIIGQSNKPAISTVTPSPLQSVTPFADAVLQVFSPLPGSAVASPLVIRGRAKGTWYFEASFPVVLVGLDGRVIAQVPAQALSDWQTTDWVPFEATLSFAKPSSSQGFLVFKKDNPSGLPQNDDSRQIPVTF